SSAPGKQGYVTADEANRLTQRRNAAPAAVILDPDGRIGRAYDARTTPQMYIIAPDQRLAFKGAVDDDPTHRPGNVEGAHNYVRAALGELRAGLPVSEPFPRPYGCSVKYAD
ncbi:MAG: thioredoxin family protein, partial [Alphaproteobacteria bacterium]